MSTPSDAVQDRSAAAQAVAPAAISARSRLCWSVRRELWESRSIYLAPLAVAPLIVLGSLIGMAQLPAKLRGAAALDPMKQHALLEQPYVFAALLLMFTTLVVAVFYCLDALYGERRDRSVLFWKSLPVSDLTTVLAKASVPILILPLVTWVVTVATQFVMLLLSSVVLAAAGGGVADLWGHVPLLQMSLMLLYHLVILHGFWYAPFYGWLLLVSAWSRRAPLLWAVLPPLAIGFVEKIAFNTSHFATLLGHRFMGDMGQGSSAAEPMSMASLMPLHPAQYLVSPGFLGGLLITAALLAVAVRLRRHRGPI